MQYISDFTYACTTAAWTPNGKQVVIGSQDDKIGCGIWDLDGQQVHNFCEDVVDYLRVNDLAISPDGQRLVVVSENTIVVFDFVSHERIAGWECEDVKLTSVSISQDSRHMLISMSPNIIKLMEVDTGDVIQTFQAHQQKEYVIRSAFGGADENFVVSGSEGKASPTMRRALHDNSTPCEAIQPHVCSANNRTLTLPK